jgi:hypothetical protein
MPLVKGKADGKLVNEIVAAQLDAAGRSKETIAP